MRSTQIEHYFHKNITNSRELCNWIGSQWSGATFNIVDDSAPNHKTCFTGVGAEVIGASECQPFDFSKSLAPPPPPGRAPPPGTKKDTGGCTCAWKRVACCISADGT